MKHVCCHCGTLVHWWDLKSSFSCPECGQALRANVVEAWTVTFTIWTIAEAIIFVLMPMRGFPGFLLRMALSLLAGAIVGWIAFGSLAHVASASEVTDQ